MQSASAVRKRKYQPSLEFLRTPSQTVLDKDDPGLTGTDYVCRLDNSFNTEYLLACHLERQRYFTSARAANS